MSFELVKQATVEVQPVHNRKGQVSAKIIVNDKYEHQFPHTSRVSKHLTVMDANDLSERLTGGSYFFIEDQLVDFRDGQYDGFVQSDQGIAKFMEVLGYVRRADLTMQRTRLTDENRNDIILRKAWSDHGIEVPGYKEGGQFTSSLNFTWNPFVHTVDSVFELVRMICTNGMVGTTSFLNTKIPLVNRWEEHLDIANRQIQNKVTSMVVKRVETLANARATVGDCLLIEQHAADRAQADALIGTAARHRAVQLMAAVSPRNHLRHVYQDSVFADKTIASRVPSHLTMYDLYNIATELRSHVPNSARSSDFALDRIANDLMFSRRIDDASRIASVIAAPAVSNFADAERAFYGVV